jgi:regulator of nucleoside diphosphate kinase
MLARADLPAKPPIFVLDTDYEQLSKLAIESGSPGSVLLIQELERATVVKEGEGPPAFVRLNSTVEFTDLVSGRTRTVTLVSPGEADMDENRLSVLAPAGAALLGLGPGATFSWTVGGRPRVLVVNRGFDGAAKVHPLHVRADRPAGSELSS